jgi:peptidoglycan/LPS O-acetylase OafA/YrhL
LFHFTSWEHVVSAGLLYSSLQKIGIYCVEIFFIISGFSLTLAYFGKPIWRGIGIAGFAVRRFFRIVPLLYLVFLATIVLIFLQTILGHPSQTNYTITKILKNFALIPIVISPSEAISVGSWSLGVEIGLYCLFPIFLFATSQPRVFFFGGVTLVILLALFSAFLFVPSSSFDEAWPMYATVINHIHFFCAGMLLAVMHIYGWMPNRRWLMAILALSLIALVAAYPDISDRLEIVVGVPRIVFTIASIGIVAGIAAFAFQPTGPTRPLVWLGDISYSVYLVHPLVYRVVPGHTKMGPLVSIVVCTALTLIAATIVHRSLELPFQRFGRALSQMTRKSSAVAD